MEHGVSAGVSTGASSLVRGKGSLWAKQGGGSTGFMGGGCPEHGAYEGNGTSG